MKKDLRPQRYYIEYYIYIKTHYDLYRLIRSFIITIDLRVINYKIK